MLISRVTCELCGKPFGQITHSHLMKAHGISIKEYVEAFPDSALFEQDAPKKRDGKALLLDALQHEWDKLS